MIRDLVDENFEGLRNICGIFIDPFDVGKMSFERSIRNTIARVLGNCCCHEPWSISHHRLHFAISRNTHDFISHVNFAIHLVLYHLPLHILHNTDTCCQTRPATKKQKSTSATLGNWGKPCVCFGQGTQVARKFCLCVVDSNLWY